MSHCSFKWFITTTIENVVSQNYLQYSSSRQERLLDSDSPQCFHQVDLLSSKDTFIHMTLNYFELGLCKTAFRQQPIHFTDEQENDS